MTEKKEKSRDATTKFKKDNHFKNKKRKIFGSRNKKEEANEKRSRRGPHLPNALQKELDLLKCKDDEQLSDGDLEKDSDGAVDHDVYEYEEEIPEEESKKNRRYDTVENYEFELPKDFEDWKVASDEDEDEDEYNANGSENEIEDDGKHSRMLEDITGLPSDVFNGSGKKKKDFANSEAYTESEYNPTSDVLNGDGQTDFPNYLATPQVKPYRSQHRTSAQQIKKETMSTALPKPEKECLYRRIAYDLSKKDITKWEPLVKRNREAPTIYFDEDVDLGFSTIGAIASEFKPRTDFEKKIASLVSQNEVVEAHKKDGARLLELNKISIEDVKDRQNYLAKMRSYLFNHEMKAKKIKKIKSKSYHRRLKKERKNAAELAIEMDPDAAKELAMKQEFKRAEERMTLKHKNTSKWAKRILERGLNVQDESTRAALGEQLNQHAALTRKMNSMKESSSSDESSDDGSDDMDGNSDEDVKSNLLKAKEKTLEILQGDEELPTSGLLSLPFVARGLKKRKEAVDEEAKLALEEYENSLKQLEGENGSRNCDQAVSSGRMAFGVTKKVVEETSKKDKVNNYYGNSDSENDDDPNEDNAFEHNQVDKSVRVADIDHNLLREEFGISHDSIFKSFQDAEDTEPKTTYEVAYLASDSWKKVKQSSVATKHNKDHSNIPKSDLAPIGLDQNIKENDDDSDSDEEMVDGILSSGPKSTYELPSQAELIQRAFAGDDVEEDFEKEREAVLNEENPEPEKPVLIPGWGQWTDIQKKKGLPSWMVAEHDMAIKKREESLKKRKDAHLNHVIISEKLSKKAEKLHTKTLPYPYTSQEVFEQSMRMPIGPEFNPAIAVAELNRPEVVKKPGIIIKPIKYEDISVHERAENGKAGAHKQKNGKGKKSIYKKVKQGDKAT